LFPGLAVAEQLRQMDGRLRITFAGSGSDFERRHVASAGFDYLALASRPLPKSPWETVRFLREHMAGYRAAMRFLRHEQVDVVVGLGGYVSVPMGRAAAARGVPLVLLEQNATPGRATRWLAPSATLICAAFEASRSGLRATCPVRVTGTPIRLLQRVRAGDVHSPESSRAAGAEPPHRRLLILGGSRGARDINRLLPAALYKLGTARDGWQIVHQAGESDATATAELYRKFAVSARVVPFLNDVRSELGRTSLAVCRAGGTTLAELATAGTPAVLIPYASARDDHQRANAELFAASAASLMFDTREVQGRADDQLAQTLARLLGDPAERAQMSAAMRRLARPDAAWHVATMVRGLLRPRPVLQAG